MPSSDALDEALKSIPDGLRKPLIEQFEKLLSEYRAGDWEAVGLKAGKICEIVYSIIAGYLSGNYPDSPSKPRNMVSACQALEQAPNTFSRSLKVQIPRILIGIYELRNNRDIGHIGGEVDPNHMDAEYFVRSSKWLVAELVRKFGNLDTEAARELIESVTERSLPAVWREGDKRRILKTALSARHRVLVLCYSEPEGLDTKTLQVWAEYKNTTDFRKKVLRPLHKDALIDFDEKTGIVQILPPGIRAVEMSDWLDFS